MAPRKASGMLFYLQFSSGKPVYEEAGRGTADLSGRITSRTIRSHLLVTARKDTAKVSIFVITVSMSSLASAKMGHHGTKPKTMDGSQEPTFSRWMRLYPKAQL